MSFLRVWAPEAAKLEIEQLDRRLAMKRAEEGWWTSVEPVSFGVDYAFFIDGEGPWPDPRSASQPSGVHGPSRTVDHAVFRWSDQSWVAPTLDAAVIYELHVGTFTPVGTFTSTIERLDHLRDLGVTHVELMPVAEFPGDRGWGYDGVDLYAPHHSYGGPDGLKTLVDACHARGLGVILDVVYNHFGPAGNYWSRFGPYLTQHYKTPWGEAVNLDGAGSDHVRRYFCDNALIWLRAYHFDGLRLDAVHAIFDRSATHFLEQLATEVAALGRELGRNFVIIAESDLNDPRLVRPSEAGGYEIDAQWSDDFHHALHALLTGEREGYYRDFGKLDDLAKALQQAFVYDGRYSIYRNRRHGRSPTGLSGNRFICCTQNHDQVGNRARGDRLAHLVSPGRLKIAATMLLMSPFVPMLFQGEEWAASTPFQYFTGHEDPDLARAVSEGRKREFAEIAQDANAVPDPQSPGTFLSSKLDWSECSREPHRQMLEWYRELIALRRRTPALTNGRMEEVEIYFDEAKQWFVMWRDPITVAFNLSGDRQRIEYPGKAGARLIMASRAGIVVGKGAIELPPDSIAILTDC
ncbi:MAG TPA: malto-oligosyltrehalose trehalohydrolase [Candidatus Binataceae bacterium]|nr:malto-oligosyltrehalose trehalohydrolase [Candidatus Binataceae bacterium]